MSLVSEHERNSESEMLTINEIAQMYRRSPSSVRYLLKAHPDIVNRYERGAGPRGDRYPVDSIEKVLGPSPDQNLTDTQRRIFSNQIKRFPTTPALPRRNRDEGSDLIVTLKSRRGQFADYLDLLKEMIETQPGLRIRAITATDFFSAHHSVDVAFFKRVQNGLGETRVLLLHPKERGACIRSAAEGNADLEKSQLYRDATSTVAFIRDNTERLKLNVKWTVDIPYSMLVWTEVSALVETYDYGSFDRQSSRCIGRDAPVLVVRGNTDYHRLLKEGFDYIFDGEERVTHLKTFPLKEVAKVVKS